MKGGNAPFLGYFHLVRMLSEWALKCLGCGASMYVSVVSVPVIECHR